MRYFTSDTHFDHANIIRYCNRPFKDTWSMNKAIIDNWNSVVNPGDTVYHLGDVAFCGADKTIEILNSLNGYKILIRGNHDKGLKQMVLRGFQEARNNDQLTLLDGRMVNVSHYPYYEHFENSSFVKPKLLARSLRNDGRWLLCGHVHDTWKNIDKMVNMGVDVWDFKPVSEFDLCNFIKEIEDEKA